MTLCVLGRMNEEAQYRRRELRSSDTPVIDQRSGVRLLKLLQRTVHLSMKGLDQFGDVHAIVRLPFRSEYGMLAFVQRFAARICE